MSKLHGARVGLFESRMSDEIGELVRRLGGTPVIAPAVRDMLLEYWGGSDSGWLATWDGTSPGADGSTPQGPPAAIRITLKMVVRPARGDQPELVQEFQHVVGIPTANIVQPAGTTGQ